jgi:glycosyltransferase involved in cell wall biosynthesis
MKDSTTRTEKISTDGAEVRSDLVCLCHLKWQFVYQRPQHLMTRCARERRVFFIEEPSFEDAPESLFSVHQDASGVSVIVPHLPHGLTPMQQVLAQRQFIDEVFTAYDIRDYLLWYYTPMARAFTNHLSPTAIVYDCMDELSLFHGAPPGLKQLEADLLSHASVVFTGGVSLYEAKKEQHRNIHAMPSSIDVDHFKSARLLTRDPEDQRLIPRPRVGFAGVIDERLDIALLDAVAAQCSDVHFVMIGPVVKIDPATLPKRANIHYLGMKPYADLPSYLAGWDAAIMPFALNEATRYISPTKTPEYLAAGRPVISTPVTDVVRPYGEKGLVYIARTPGEFSDAIQQALNRGRNEAARKKWMALADSFLSRTSWDKTWRHMMSLVESTSRNRNHPVIHAAANLNTEQGSSAGEL